MINTSPSLFADFFGLIQAIGAIWIGFQIFTWLRAHPKLVHLDNEHLFLAASLPVLLLLLIITSNWLLVFAFLAVGWVAIVLMVLHVVLCVIGFVKLVHWGFEIFGGNNSNNKPAK